MVINTNNKYLELTLTDLLEEETQLLAKKDTCKNQIRGTIDDAQKMVLSRNLDNLNKQIGEIQKQIEEVNSQLHKNDISGDVNRRFLALEEKLPKIDFKEPLKIVQNILKDFDEYGAAFFLVNDSLSMAGDLFILELKDLLKRETTDLKHYEIEFSVSDRLDEIGFLQGIANYLGMGQIETQANDVNVIDKIIDSLENGTIVFVETRKVDLINDKGGFLSWLIEVFWKKVVEQIPLVCKAKDIEQVRFINIILSDCDLEEECSILPFFCEENDFDMCKAVKITLPDWSEQEIKTWLIKHSGLSKDKIEPMSKSIYKSSRGGIPKLICEALKNKLK